MIDDAKQWTAVTSTCCQLQENFSS